MRAVYGPYRVLLSVLLVGAVTVPAAAQGRVFGTIRDEDGKPIKGATVVARHGGGVPSTMSVASDDRGRFSMLGLQNGEWEFVVSAPGYESQIGTGQVRTISPNPPVEFKLTRKALLPPLPLANVEAAALQNQLDTADGLLDDGRYDEAIAAYQAISNKAPALTLVNLQISRAWRLKGDADRALAAATVALRADDTNPRAQLEVALARLQRGDLREAETLLSRLTDDPDAASIAVIGMGDICAARHEPRAATEWYQQGVRLAPMWAVPRLKLARLALATGDVETAAHHFAQVLALAAPASDEASVAKDELRKLGR